MAEILRDNEGRLRTVWRFGIFLVGFVLLYLIIGMALGIILTVLDLFDPSAAMDDIFFLFAVVAFPLSVCVFGWVAVCRHFFDHRSVRSMGLTASRKDLVLAALGGTAAGGGLVGFTLLILWALGVYSYAGAGGGSDAVLLLVGLPFAAFNEEVICRGYLLQNLRDIGRPVAGVIISSAIFAMLHSLNPGVWFSLLPMLSLFLVGVVFALSYMLSGNIWFPTALHFAWNTMEGPVLGTPVSGMSVDGFLQFEPVQGAQRILSGGSFGMEGSLVLVLIQCAVILGLLLWMWQGQQGYRDDLLQTSRERDEAVLD